MIRKFFFKTFFNPVLCNKIDLKKYPWGWKSQEDIKRIIEHPTNNANFGIDFNRRFIHEHRLIKYTKDMYTSTYFAYHNDYDFLNSNLFSPSLSNGLNFLKSRANLTNFNENIQIHDVTLIASWIKYGKVKNQTKLFGLYDPNDFIHEISTGMIGPEFQSVWDQQSIKQKVRMLINLNERKDVFEFERNLMVHNDNWQLCNINRIIK